MPQRNGQNPIKSNFTGKQQAAGVSAAGASQTQSQSTALRCSKCNAEVPLKPGFRPSALKCPKCGAPAVKK